MRKVERIDQAVPKQVSQTDLQDLAYLQRAAWRAHAKATAFATKLARRIDLGATVEDGPMYFDISLGMARGRGGEERTG